MRFLNQVLGRITAMCSSVHKELVLVEMSEYFEVNGSIHLPEQMKHRSHPCEVYDSLAHESNRLLLLSAFEPIAGGWPG